MTAILIILFLLILNGFFAMCEIALVSSRKSKLLHEADKGSKGAKTALKLLEDPARFLSTVQVGITLIGIIAGAYGAEAFTGSITPFFERIKFIGSYAYEITFAVIVTLITYFSLVIGELVPKSIALNNPEKITITFSPVMKILALITYPVVVFLSFSTKIFLKMLFIKRKKEPPVTEEEIKHLIDTGSRYGIIEKEEGQIMQGVITFADRKASDVMTLRGQIKWLNINETKKEILNYVFRHSSTKYPVCDGSPDKILGVISVTDIVKYSASDSEIDFNKYMVEPVFFYENTSTLRILDDFRRKKIHIGFVIDESGGSTRGLITLHDLVENIIGDLPEWNDEPSKIIFRPDGSVLLDGNLHIEEVKKTLRLENLPLNSRYKNLAEFVLHKLNVSPRTGAEFIFEKYRFEIVDMDRDKIDKVLVSEIPDR